MKLLLDTHTFFCWSLEPERLPKKVIETLKDPGNEFFLSVASSWEAQIKAGLGKLVLLDSLEKIIRREISTNGWKVLPVHLEHTWKLSEIPPLHKDPFDRLLIAQSLVEGLAIIGKDPLFSAYPHVRIIWSEI